VNKVKTAAIYARVSSEKQKQEQTIDSQVTELEEFGRSGVEVVFAQASRGPAPAGVSRGDCGVRESANHGAEQAREKTPSQTGSGQPPALA
jgi:hypothetical protein